MFKKFLSFLLLLPVSMLVRAQDNGLVPATAVLIKVIPGLQYDLVRFVVKPGTKVTLTLANTDEMDHNLLVTRPGKRMEVVNAALQLAGKGPQLGYIPNTEQILWAIPVVSPGQQKSVTFVAPSMPGVYPYVCTYPGHGFLMYGAMYVMQEGVLPEIASDVNIPEGRRKDTAAIQRNVHTAHVPEAPSPHAYTLTPPYLYRVFIEGASPAAIVVRLPVELAYCWDAGTCKLRFAWKGGFVDNTDLWKGHSDASAKILGDVFFRDNLDYPFRLGENALRPTIKFKGYRLVDKYPEFHYTIDGLDVYEMIHSKEDGNGLVRDFRIPAASEPVWFYTNHQDDGMGYACSTGKWADGRLELTPAEARRFTITMTSYHLAFQQKKK